MFGKIKQKETFHFTSITVMIQITIIYSGCDESMSPYVRKLSAHPVENNLQ